MKQTTLGEWRQWHSHGLALREKYERERDELRQRLGEIDVVLKDLPVKDDGTAYTTESGAVDAPKKRRGRRKQDGRKVMKKNSVPSAVIEAFVESKTPLLAKEVIEAVQRTRNDIPGTHIYTALRRLRIKGTLTADGEEGERRYRLAS